MRVRSDSQRFLSSMIKHSLRLLLRLLLRVRLDAPGQPINEPVLYAANHPRAMDFAPTVFLSGR